jgi:prephenate dehydrogenase
MPAPDSGIAAVRGAIQVSTNQAAAIHEATARLLGAMLERNRITPSQIVSAVFTATADLDADFPAHAARRLGWTDVPLLGAVEMDVPGALARVVRVLLTVQGVAAGARLAPVYLDGAAALRPDLAPPAAPPGPRHRLAIVGLGQIGGSIGLALAAPGAGWERVGFDADRATLDAALAAGAVDRAAGSLAEACAGAELAVIAVPADALAATVDAAAAALPAGAALMDTGSARAGVTAALERAVARGIAAVGGHPLAGTEGRGFGAARADLMRGARFVLLPVAGAAGAARTNGTGVPPIVVALIESLGATVQTAEPAVHDAALARTSHLPYLLACALAAVGAEPHARGLSGPGFRDMTRLAASDPRMAEGYCRANAREVSEAWRALRGEMERRVGALGNGVVHP